MCMRKRERMDLDSSSLEISRSKTQASSIWIVHCLPPCAISSLSRMLGSSAADCYTFPSSSSYAHHRPSRPSSQTEIPYPMYLNIWVRRECMEDLLGYRRGNTRVASNTHVCKSPRKPIIRDVSLEECILRVKLDSVVDIRPAKDTSQQIVPHNLVAHSI